jgi:PTS system cellobiose-specific IIA component
MNRVPELEEVSLELILHGGNARAEAFEALKAAKEGDFERAKSHMEAAEEEIKTAHEAQTMLLQSDGEGANTKADLLFVHAHGHLQNAMSEKALIEELIILYKRLNKDFLHFS